MENIKIYHQCGFRDKWNIDSYTDDNVGDGLIISPINMRQSKIASLPYDIRKTSFFDPQFYVPDSEKGKLLEYEFFPNKLMDEYHTNEFEGYSVECAKACIDFQIENEFEYLVIPTIYFENFREDYLDVLRNLYVNPFLEYVNENASNKKVLLSIIVQQNQIVEGAIRDELLSFLTENIDIKGIYLIPDTKKSSKRLKDIDYIYNLLTFIDILKNNNLEVHVGYSDIVSLIYTLADVNSITVGVYENLRNFNKARFTKEETVGRSPTPRIFSSNLLQWIDYRYLGSIKGATEDISRFFDENVYRVLMFEPTYRWHFSKPELYKHYFISYQELIRSIPNNFEERFSFISGKIEHAKNEYNYLRDSGIILTDDDDGSHLNMWLTAINRYKNYKSN